MTPRESFTKPTSGPRGAVEAVELPGAVVTELARVWADAGVAAHGAAAAQAEFAVCLLRLGAPAALMRGAARAMLNESALSASCLGLACRYGAEPLLLTPVPKPERAGDVDRNELVLGTLRSGCIAATVEASCAREALEHCQEAAPREVLRQLQQGRAHAAQLAWRFLGWALRDTGRELADQVRVAVLTALSAQSKAPQLSPCNRLLLRHGVLAPQQRLSIEQRVLRDIVLPCMENALARAHAGRAA